MTTTEVLAALTATRADLDAALTALGERVSTAPITPDGWTAKDTVAHMTHWVGQVAWGMGAPLTPPAYIKAATGRPSFEQWNALAVAHFRVQPYEAAKGRLDLVMDALAEQVARRTDEEMNATDAIPWGGNRPLWHQIGTETFLHWPAHISDLRAAASWG
jgi:hypothetical protein